MLSVWVPPRMKVNYYTKGLSYYLLWLYLFGLKPLHLSVEPIPLWLANLILTLVIVRLVIVRTAIVAHW